MSPCVPAASQEPGAKGAFSAVSVQCGSQLTVFRVPWSCQGKSLPLAPFTAPVTQLKRGTRGSFLKCFSKVSVFISDLTEACAGRWPLGTGSCAVTTVPAMRVELQMVSSHVTGCLESGVVCCSFHLDSTLVEGPLVWVESQQEIKLSCP